MMRQGKCVVRQVAIGAVTISLLTGASFSAGDDRPVGRDFFECGSVMGMCAPDECASLINITIMRDGGVKWNGSQIDKKTLIGWLGDTARVKPQSVFWIDPDADTSYATAARVIQLFHQTGIKRMYCVVPDRQ